jgi:hypothetical protein
MYSTAVREDVPERMPELDLTKVVNQYCFIVGSNPTFCKKMLGGFRKTF